MTMDRRVRRTKKRLREALLGLLCTKSVEDITVSELAIKADINRGTFYTHYRDAEDLLANIENDFLKRIEDCFALGANRNILEGLFESVDAESDLFKVMLMKPYFAEFSEKFKEVIEDGCRRTWKLDEHNQKYVTDHAYYYMVWGLCGMCYEWMKSTERRSPLEMAILAEIFLMNTIRATH